MSIYATWLYFAADHGQDESEGQPPIRYRGSHILPTDDDERAGVFSICVIPNHIDNRESGGAGPGLHDWIRIGVVEDDNGFGPSASVLLDRAQVETCTRHPY